MAKRDRRAPTRKELEDRRRRKSGKPYGKNFKPGPSRRIEPKRTGDRNRITPEQLQRRRRRASTNRRT